MTGAAEALLSAGTVSGGGGGGGGGGSVSIINRTVSNTGDGTGTISVGYKLDNDGNAYKVTTATTLLEQWLDSGLNSAFEVRATKISGTTPTGSALGSWLVLSADRTWTLSAGPGVSNTCKLTVEIRDVATQTVQDSATITLTADNLGSGGGGGGGGGTVSISDAVVSKFGDGSAAVTASYRLSSDGNAYNQDGTLIEAWLDSGVAGDFEVRATHTSGDGLSSGTLGTWLLLSTSRTWSLSAGIGAVKGCTVLIEIRDASSLTVLDSATITFDAESGA